MKSKRPRFQLCSLFCMLRWSPCYSSVPSLAKGSRKMERIRAHAGWTYFLLLKMVCINRWPFNRGGIDRSHTLQHIQTCMHSYNPQLAFTFPVNSLPLSNMLLRTLALLTLGSRFMITSGHRLETYHHNEADICSSIGLQRHIICVISSQTDSRAIYF